MGLAPAHPCTSQVNNESDLITQSKQGDRWAFSELVRQHRSGVINVVYRMCGDANIAEDAAQEAFIRAWQHLEKYQPKAAFRTWLYRIAINSAHNIIRKQKPTVDMENFALRDKTPGPERSVENKELAHTIQQAVLSLPEASRSVLVLREYGGLSYREIADTLGIPMGTVMSRLNYARRVLRRLLAVFREVG